MALSNTATPIYYGRFRDKVLSGEIPVNQMISLEMNRIDALIEEFPEPELRLENPLLLRLALQEQRLIDERPTSCP